MPELSSLTDDAAERARIRRVIKERVAAAPPLTEAQIERLRPMALPLFRKAAEQLAARDG